MKDQLIAREVKCIDDCIRLARISVTVGNLKLTRMLLEDALKSINEVERLSSDETVVLIGTFMPSRNSNDI